MARGPGKFDELCEYVRMLAEAKGAMIIIAQGNLGGGVACRMELSELKKMPELLRQIANQIEADLAAPHWPPL